MSLIGNASSIPGVTAITVAQAVSPNLLIVGAEKTGKSSLAVTAFGWPTPAHQPLIIATDPTGADSCLVLGYGVHAIHVYKQPGSTFFAKTRAAIEVVEKNIKTISQQYGCLIFDDFSTMSYRILEDERRFSKNPDPRSSYFSWYQKGNEIWLRLSDLAAEAKLPVIWISWSGDKSLEENGDYAAPDIAGKKFARAIAGRAQHICILERRFIGKGQPTADLHGFGRILHTVPWNGVNAGGRLSHLLPEPMPANLAMLLSMATGRTP